MAQANTKKKLQMFHATMHVTRIEHWCVEAETAEEARELLAAGEGHRCDVGDLLNADLHKIHE